jgi:hypothetical protein
MIVKLCGVRHLVLVLLGALGLGGTAELLGAVLPLLAWRGKKTLALGVVGEGSFAKGRGSTYAAGGKASRPWWRHQCEPDGRQARTSSGPPGSRRPGRNQCSYHHRTECGTRRRRPGPCWTCTGRPASRGARPWRRWDGWGGGHP